ncbi:hypothetical protein GN277_18205 [Lachnospiraceae bacterium WCA-9-b2]|uniref:Uncharacterized protein n=1 Tax=Sporofaciens musculi TaxID=2681861 RepID=A0A7X3MIW0_9FIRM|nr:hypothetical protein [Sporofaciens musculi]MXP77239.1 hypothetical protein [Sporofaciens musculi]
MAKCCALCMSATEKGVVFSNRKIKEEVIKIPLNCPSNSNKHCRDEMLFSAQNGYGV